MADLVLHLTIYLCRSVCMRGLPVSVYNMSETERMNISTNIARPVRLLHLL